MSIQASSNILLAMHFSIVAAQVAKSLLTMNSNDNKRATAAGEISADKSRMTKIKKADLHSMVVQT